MSHRGDPNVFTPNLDNLARNGMRFDCAVSGAPWCAPFRGALLTGTYPHQNRVTQTPSPLDPSFPTVADAFNDAGPDFSDNSGQQFTESSHWGINGGFWYLRFRADFN